MEMLFLTKILTNIGLSETNQTQTEQLKIIHVVGKKNPKLIPSRINSMVTNFDIRNIEFVNCFDYLCEN